MSAKSVRRVLTHPLALISIGALVLALLVWFVGPLLVVVQARILAQATIRLAAILGIALLWGIAAITLQARRDGQDRRLLAALRREEAESVATSARDHSAVEAKVAVLRRKVDEILGFLGRETSPGRWRPRAHRLPWYLVVGPSRSGKSALLASAGLNFPFGPPQDWSGPTEDCSFVFSENAVFLDVAGRYAEASAGSFDDQVWLRLLDIVRRLRRRQPICGIVLALDVSELASLSEDRLRLHGQAMRRMLDRIAERLQARPPVYLVVTKLDRVLGFTTFFETLDRAEREQLWGIPLLASEEDRETAAAERYRSGFADLVRRVSGWQIQRLHEEPDAQRRALVYEFPDHLAALGAVLEPIVEIIALPHRFDRPPFLRGVFLSSALQVGLAIDLLGAPAGGSFGQATGLMRLSEPASGHSRSFFLAALIRDFIVSEAAAGGLTRRTRRVSTAWQVTAAASAAVLIFALVAHWVMDYRALSAYAADVGVKADAVAETLSSTHPASALPPFGVVLPLLQGLASLQPTGPTSSPGAMALPHLASEISRTYAAGLDRLFLPYLKGDLATTLGDASASPFDTFAALQLYLALGGQHPFDELDLQDIADGLTRSWFSDKGDAQRRGFAAQIVALAAHPVPRQAVDPALAETARRRIARYTLAQLALDLARRQPGVAALPDWRPNDHAGSAAQIVLMPLSGGTLWDGLPGLYTRDAFRTAVLPALRSASDSVARNAWVMSKVPSSSAESILAGALTIYAADYIRAYDTLLSGLTSQPMPNARAGARTLSVLIAAPSPVAELMRAVAVETDLSPPAAPGAPPALDILSPPTAVSEAEHTVTEAFAPLRRATSGPKGQPSQVEAALAGFEPLYREVNLIARGGNPLELGSEPQAVTAAIDATVAQLPPSIQPVLKRIEVAAMQIVKGASTHQLKDVWNTTVLPSCSALTKDRYPFSPRSSKDASLDDFKAVFAPEGLIAAFRDTYLKPLIDTHSTPWVWRPGQPGDLGIASGILSDFEQADKITKTFFVGGQGPQARFTLEIADLDGKAEAASLDVGGQSLRVAHGPATPMAGQWPAPVPNAPAVLSLTPEIPGEQNMLVGEGPWGLFRLLSQSGSHKVVNGTILYSFSLSSRSITVKLTPSLALSAFDGQITRTFKCPVL